MTRPSKSRCAISTSMKPPRLRKNPCFSIPARSWFNACVRPSHRSLPAPAKSGGKLIYTVQREHFRLKLPSRTLILGDRTLIMGVLNVTPDSFSDGGHYFDSRAAIAHAFEMERAGADLISIDTSKSHVANAAIQAGAEIVNDVTGLRADPGIADAAKRYKLPLILMHMRGEPRTMHKGPFARDVMQDVIAGFKRCVALARKAGVPKSQIVLDPGLGFGKTYEQNYELIAGIPELAALGFPLLIGASRKSFVGKALGGTAKGERAWGTAATVTAAALGGAHMVRVHDVEQMAQVARVADAIVNRGRMPEKPSR